ncbi:MAG TPA: TonB-dependent receptor [Vicinamibacterales bacterium]|nr:TonB-dependent receptor [Vicinamibacterales bacterium]
MRIAQAVLSILLVGLFSSTVAAQTVTGTVQGTVSDPTGAVLPGASVVLRNLDTGAVRELTTNEVGFYTAPFLAVGRYSVTARLNGFGTVVRDEVEVGLNQTRVADFQLKPSTVVEAVTVVGAAPPINTTNAEVKGTLSAQQIMDKPTLSPGSFLSLAEIFAGFQENPTSGQNNPTASSGSSVNFNGTGTRGATFQINGVNNDDSSENQNRQGAALSTIKEFQVITNTYSAEFGRGYGAVVLVQTKSGTNQWRGDVYEFLQDSNDLTELRHFAAVKPDNQRHQFGGTAGFPIKPNRLFGFVSFDRTKLGGTQNYARDFLLANERVPRLTRGNDTPENRAWIESIIARYPNEEPNDARSNRAHATVIGFHWPAEDYSGRVDWQRGQDSVTARYQYTHQLFETDDVIIGEQARQDNRQQNLGMTWTKIFRNSLIAEFRYGLGIRDTNVNIAAGNDTPIVRFANSPFSSTIIGNAGMFPILRDQLDNQFVYNLSWLFAQNHMLKTGTDIRRQHLDDHADNNSRGFWNFNRVCAGVTYSTAYDAFLDGCIASFTKAWGPFFLENRINESNFYVEDNWRVRPNLTLNLGFRYEYVSAPKEKESRIDYGFGADTDNYEPRLGAAWTLPPSDSWLRWMTGGATGDASLRGGYGLYHGRIFQSVFSQSGATLRFNPPNALSREFTQVLNVSDPTLGFVFVPGPQTVRHNITLTDANLEMPYTHQWSLSLERRLPFDSSLRVTYNGNHVIGTLKYALNNLPQSPLVGPVLVVDHPNNAPASGFPDLRGKTIDRIAADVQCAGTGFLPNITVNATCPVPVPIADNEISLRVPRTNERRPDPRYTTNLKVSNEAESWYDGVQFEWVKRFSKGLQFIASYTRSKSEDTTSEATFVGAGDSNQQGPNKQYAKGYSRFHTPHRFSFNGSYLLPFWRDRRDLLGTLAGGWQVSAVVKLASGTPFTVTQPTIDLDFDGFSEGRPVIVDRSVLGRSVDDPATSTTVLPATAFRRYVAGDTIDQVVPRNAFFGDGFDNVDFGLYKNFRLPSGQTFSLRIEAYNLFNTDQFAFPATDVTGTAFGQITTMHSVYIPRTIQIAFRLRY